MICSVCKKRFAPFPEEDFYAIPFGFTPRNTEAATKRDKVFESDEVGICGSACEEVLDLMALAPLISDI